MQSLAACCKGIVHTLEKGAEAELLGARHVPDFMGGGKALASSFEAFSAHFAAAPPP